LQINRFITFDFETANNQRDSACALGIAMVENFIITEQYYSLIRPATKYFCYTHVHGIKWDDVKYKPTFGELWSDIKKYFNNIDFAASHNIIFDRGVLNACCDYYGINKPDIKYECTLQQSRKRLDLKSKSLDSVSAHYGIQLEHHNALSDSLACANIMINFLKEDIENER